MRENTDEAVWLTEAEWLAAADFGRMVNHVWTRAGTRKQLLLAVAFCRRIWDQPPNDDCRADGSHVRGCWAVDLLLGKG